MKITVKRIKLNSQGYDTHGIYWGVGERLYYSPEVEDLYYSCHAHFVESPYVRERDYSDARDELKQRAFRMSQHPKPIGDLP